LSTDGVDEAADGGGGADDDDDVDDDAILRLVEARSSGATNSSVDDDRVLCAGGRENGSLAGRDIHRDLHVVLRLNPILPPHISLVVPD
jgi:hypothetical protein